MPESKSLEGGMDGQTLDPDVPPHKDILGDGKDLARIAVNENVNGKVILETSHFKVHVDLFGREESLDERDGVIEEP